MNKIPQPFSYNLQKSDKRRKFYPPIPENRTGKGERSLREAIRREAMESPETSPATIKTLNSPSLAAISIGALNLA